jgi:hypothetical protein
MMMIISLIIIISLCIIAGLISYDSFVSLITPRMLAVLLLAPSPMTQLSVSFAHLLANNTASKRGVMKLTSDSYNTRPAID